MASNTIEILARSGRSWSPWRSWRSPLADCRPRPPSIGRRRGQPIDEPRGALDAGAVPARVIPYLAIVRDHDDRPRARRPEGAQRLGDSIADHLVRGGVAAERHGERRRNAAARTPAGMPIEDQLDLVRWPERGAEPRDERGRREPLARTANPARQRELDVSAVDQDPARAHRRLVPAADRVP